MLSVRHILVPIDFSDPSRAATDLAVELAQKFDAQITLVNVFEVSLYLYSGGPFMPVVDTTNALEQAAKEATAARLAEVKKKWAKSDAVVRFGQPWNEILATIGEKQIDLVVMGTHGRQGLPHALLGSVAERVVRTAAVPVLTVRTTKS